jgi:serine/threonine-protein phosphatase 2A regulatory subunit A
LSFLKDEQEQQVKQTIFKKVALICETLGIETLSQSILPVLDEMVASNNWRTRS